MTSFKNINISIIVAIGKNNQIGLNNQIPWDCPEDLVRFKKLTLENILLMGRKTYQSINKPLLNRHTIILSSTNLDLRKNEYLAKDIDQALKIFSKLDKTELFICGGEKVYKYFLDHAQIIYLTKFDYDKKADTYFPKINEKLFKTIEEKRFDDHTFSVLERLEIEKNS